jgi:NAD(P)H-flavin reductase/ferredoxin
METIDINFEDNLYRVPRGVSLLDSLQEAGAKIPASCRAGVCQSCLMQSIDLAPPPHSQKDLSHEKKKQGYFLACQCLPIEPMKVRLADEAVPSFDAVVVERSHLSSDILLVRFRRPPAFEFYAGQYVNFFGPHDLVRSYSIASLPGERDFFDIHVRQIPGGKMTGWFFNECVPGARLRMTAPRGDCCYLPDSEDPPFLLVGIGTGVAPLQAIAREALMVGKQSAIYFYQGALNPERLYYRQELKSLTSTSTQFFYDEIVLNGTSGDCQNSHITEVLIQNFKKIKQTPTRNSPLVNSPLSGILKPKISNVFVFY